MPHYLHVDAHRRRPACENLRLENVLTGIKIAWMLDVRQKDELVCACRWAGMLPVSVTYRFAALRKLASSGIMIVLWGVCNGLTAQFLRHAGTLLSVVVMQGKVTKS
jgi:hypothetical protein